MPIQPRPAPGLAGRDRLTQAFHDAAHAREVLPWQVAPPGCDTVQGLAVALLRANQHRNRRTTVGCGGLRSILNQKLSMLREASENSRC